MEDCVCYTVLPFSHVFHVTCYMLQHPTTATTITTKRLTMTPRHPTSIEVISSETKMQTTDCAYAHVCICVCVRVLGDQHKQKSNILELGAVSLYG